jgi:hypothetical protein
MSRMGSRPNLAGQCTLAYQGATGSLLYTGVTRGKRLVVLVGQNRLSLNHGGWAWAWAGYHSG